MRILQICKFYHPVMGGIETVAWELAEGFSRLGLHSDVLCSNQRAVTERQTFPAGYDVVRAASFGMLLSTSMAPALIRELRRIQADYDVIHIHMPDPMAAVALKLSGTRARVVVHWHSDVIRQRRAMHLYEPLQRWVLKRADAVVTTSAAYGTASIALLPWLHKVTVIPIGISDNRDDDYQPKTELIREEFKGKSIVFALGRMTYYKGFEVLINAAKALPDDSVVLIGGDGVELARHRVRVAELGLGDKVHLLGHINDGDLPSYFKACDVFCMSSTKRAEAYGVSMVEAMVMGKAVVSTDIPGSGVPWVNVHGHTGYNAPVGEPGRLAETLTQLLRDDALRARLGAAARERYLEEFNSDKMVDKTVALYESLTEASVLSRVKGKSWNRPFLKS